MIVCRPVPGERNHAGGEIVKSAPTQPGKKGFTYTPTEAWSFYSLEGAKDDAAQMKAICQKWREADQSPLNE